MWPEITYEEHPWARDVDELSMIPKSRRRKITATYQAAIPAEIANASLDLPQDVSLRIGEIRAHIARFDAAQAAREYNLPALLLRSESSSSSQIERLTSSVRNVALAELSDKTSANAQMIAANVAAMREALSQSGPIDVALIERVHDILTSRGDVSTGIRREQVWIGGSAFSPHGAQFVPPHESRVRACLDDLLAFSEREDIDPIAKAALFHAQFETIHPFTDGNGRTGRTLLHRMLVADEVLAQSTLPISAGLLHNVGSYMSALDAYHEGEASPIIEQLLDALEIAMVIGSKMATEVDSILERWNEQTTDRKGSASLRLPSVLVEQPVVDVAYLAKRLDITDRAARNLVETACQRGILQKMGNAKRGAFYQASELIAIMEEACDMEGLRRMAIS